LITTFGAPIGTTTFPISGTIFLVFVWCGLPSYSFWESGNLTIWVSVGFFLFWGEAPAENFL
jgi:hypothetical protein